MGYWEVKAKGKMKPRFLVWEGETCARVLQAIVVREINMEKGTGTYMGTGKLIY